MRVGYARVSSADQNLARQVNQLNQANVDKLFQEKVSGKNTQRTQLNALLDFIRQKGAVLNILDLPSFEGVRDCNLKALLTNLVLEIQKYTAENERQKIHERQRQGIQVAKQRGVYKGRKPQYVADSDDPQKRLIYEQIVKLLQARAQGKRLPITEIARQTGVARNTVYHIQRQLINHQLLNN